MDPLSISASVLTLAAAINATLKIIRTVRGTSAEVQALCNEVTDLLAVARAVEASIGEGHEHQQAEASLFHQLFNEAKVKIQNLDEFIKTRLYKSQSTTFPNELRFSRSACLIEAPRLSRFKNELKRIRRSLAATLNAMNANCSSRIELELKSISRLMLESRADFQYHIDDLEVSRVQRGVGESIEASLFAQAGLSDQRQCSRNRQASEMAFSNESEQSDMFIQASYSARTECHAGCTCSCHHRQSSRTPSFFNTVLGSLFVGYSGLPLVGQSCNSPSCWKGRQSKTTLSYSFPQWFLSRIIFLTYQNSTLCGPQLQLKVSRVVWDQAEIFWYSLNGDIEGIRSLFISKLASPNDVAFSDNYTPLLYAVINQRIGACKLLLDAGADPNIEPSMRGSAKETAWDIIMGENADGATIKAFRHLFPNETYAEDQAFTILHCLVLGFRSGDLEMEVLKTSLAIDQVDARGRTALWWASRRGDVYAIRTLLRNGASTDIADEQGISPLYASTFPNSPVGLEVLLQHNAKITANKVGWDPLHHAAAMQDDPHYLALLLAHADTIDSVTSLGDTPLVMASQWGKCDNVKFLLDAGAKIDGANPEEYFTPLVSAIQSCQPEVVALLLNCGADHTALSCEGQNIIHGAAIYGDVAIFDTLCEFNLHGIDITTKDKFGMKPCDYLSRRKFDDELYRAFYRLIQSVQYLDQIHSDTDEVFYDAPPA